MLHWILFQTRLGNLFLTQLERRANLAIVTADTLAEKTVGVPAGLDRTTETPRLRQTEGQTNA